MCKPCVFDRSSFIRGNPIKYTLLFSFHYFSVLFSFQRSIVCIFYRKTVLQKTVKEKLDVTKEGRQGN